MINHLAFAMPTCKLLWDLFSLWFLYIYIYIGDKIIGKKVEDSKIEKEKKKKKRKKQAGSQQKLEVGGSNKQEFYGR